MNHRHLTIVITLVTLVGAACSGASPAGSTPSSSPVSSPRPTPALAATTMATPAPTTTLAPTPTSASASLLAAVRCEETDNAKPSATVQWDEVMGPEATIKAGQAVVFVTTGYFPSVTEWGTNGKPAASPCIDKRIGQDAGPMQVVVTFYQPGEYNITCRKMPEAMHTIVHVH